MSYSGDQSTPFVVYHDGLDYRPQFPIRNEYGDPNGQLEHAPPMKRARNFDDSNNNNHHQPVSNRSSQTNLPVNQPIGKIFFKTRLCARFRMGQCKNGENCNFAHGESDLRKPPPNWQELVAVGSEHRANGDGSGGNWEDDDRLIHRMKLCKKFYNGEECPYGDRCNFLHKSRDSYAISIGTSGRPVIQASAPDQNYDVNDLTNVGGERGNVGLNYWKTRISTKFEVTGHYAHGLAGGRLGEVESVMVNSAPAKPAPLLANEPVPVKIDAGVSLNQEGQGKKCHFKWKGTKKINRIYGDWLDDLPLNLPNEVGS